MPEHHSHAAHRHADTNGGCDPDANPDSRADPNAYANGNPDATGV